MASIFEQIERNFSALQEANAEAKLDKAKIKKLEKQRRQALSQMETFRGTKIIPHETLPITQPNIPIVITPKFQDFATQLNDTWNHVESAGIMQIDFALIEGQQPKPAIFLVKAFQTDVGLTGEIIRSGDEDNFLLPGEIEWHTHPKKLHQYGLNLDWQDLRNIVAGPRFVDPNHDIPDNDYRWISAIIAHYPGSTISSGLQLYLYELAKYDGENPLSGLSALGPMVKLTGNR